MQRPTRPKTPKRSMHGKSSASPLGTPMERSYAQKARSDRTLSYESMASRAAFWAKAGKQLQAQQQQEMDQSVAQITQGTPAQNTSFGAANIQSATLESAAPVAPGQATIAGLGEGGIVPPPPTR